MSRHSMRVTRRCAFSGSNGRCKRKTTITHPYCGQHTRIAFGVDVRKSGIPKAGLGLFALKTFKKGDKVVEYKGERLTVDEYDRRYHHEAMGSYGIQLDEKHVLDARKTTSGLGRYACDYHGSRKQPNVEYLIDGDDRIWLTATRTIKPGDEILADYGEEMHRALGF